MDTLYCLGCTSDVPVTDWTWDPDEHRGCIGNNVLEHALRPPTVLTWTLESRAMAVTT